MRSTVAVLTFIDNPRIAVMVFPFFFVGMWVTVSLLLARMSGWRALASS